MNHRSGLQLPADLTHGITSAIGYPDTCAIEQDCAGTGLDCKCAGVSAIPRARNRVTASWLTQMLPPADHSPATFQGLTAGFNYTLQLCAIGGSTGKSDWSDPISKMAV